LFGRGASNMEFFSLELYVDISLKDKLLFDVFQSPFDNKNRENFGYLDFAKGGCFL